MAEVAHHCLSARVYVHMLDPYVLLALAPFSRQGLLCILMRTVPVEPCDTAEIAAVVSLSSCRSGSAKP